MIDRKVRIGFLDLAGKSFISSCEINRTFLDILSGYCEVKVIALDNKQALEKTFKDIASLKLDYLYVNSFDFLFKSFLLRERLGINLAFILKIHTIYQWIFEYLHIVPLLRKYDVIYAPSLYARDSFLRLTEKFKVHIIPNFLDIRRIKKTARQKKKKRSTKTIAFVGRLVRQKGIMELLESMPAVLKQVKNIHLNIIGPLSGEFIGNTNASPFVKKLKKRARELGINKYVDFCGEKTGLDKYMLLADSDVFVNPTVAREETFGYVNIEALACGLPVIASNWAANKEIIRQARNGYLVDVKESGGCYRIDKEELSNRLKKILSSKSLLFKLKNSAFRSSGLFDHRRIMPRLLKLFRKKKRMRQNNRWYLIKNKKIIDFKGMFRQEFSFFLHYYLHCACFQSYADLYRANFFSARETQALKKKDTVGSSSRINTKINRDLNRYLLLKPKQED